MPRVLFTEAAQADLAEALAWYGMHAPDIIPRFREALRAVVARIGNNPQQFTPSSHGTRRALLRRFPYLVIFREQGDDAYVVALFHTRRDPTAWESRTFQ